MTPRPWLQRIEVGQSAVFDGEAYTLHLGNACLSNPVRETQDRTSLVLVVIEGDKRVEGVIASFFKNRTDSVKLDHTLKAGGKYELKVQGMNDVDLFAYYEEEVVQKVEVKATASARNTRGARKAAAKAPTVDSSSMAMVIAAQGPQEASDPAPTVPTVVAPIPTVVAPVVAPAATPAVAPATRGRPPKRKAEEPKPEGSNETRRKMVKLGE